MRSVVHHLQQDPVAAEPGIHWMSSHDGKKVPQICRRRRLLVAAALHACHVRP